MRLACAGLMLAAIAAACATNPAGGKLGEGGVATPRIAAIDTTVPPRVATVELDEPAYAALFLVAPGHSATLLFPSDSAIDNRLNAGTHRLQFEIPALLVETDSQRLARAREAQRTAPRRRPARVPGSLGPIPTGTPTYLLLLTSPQPLVYERLIEKTGGVSIPNIDTEALNAVAKAIKSTLASEPRNWAGTYEPVEVRRLR